MCVGNVCTHPSYNDKKYLLNPYFKIPFLKSGCSEIHVRITPSIVDWQDRLTLDPPWVSWELSVIVSAPVQGKTFIITSNN